MSVTEIVNPPIEAQFSLPTTTPSPRGNGAAAAPAPGGWFSGTVINTGAAEDGTVFIALQFQSGTQTLAGWYYATPAVKKEMLATALTAIATGHRLDFNLVSTDYYSAINRLYLNKQ